MPKLSHVTGLLFLCNILRMVQYLKNDVSGEVDFLHADKHGSLPQIDAMIFDGDGQTFPKFPK